MWEDSKKAEMSKQIETWSYEQIVFAQLSICYGEYHT